MLDPVEKEAIDHAAWKSRLPEGHYLKELTALQAIGELKKRGHIRSITLVNAPPRTVSTIIAKCLAESPSLNLQGTPIFHEVLNDSGDAAYHPSPADPYSSKVAPRKTLSAQGEHYLGSNVLIGKLIDCGILEKKGCDLVLKIMSHEFHGKDLEELLPYVDNAVSTLRQPAQHIECIDQKVLHDIANGDQGYSNESHYDPERDVCRPMRQYWKTFAENVDRIDRWVAEHPQHNTRHAVINGDKFLHDPEGTLGFVCDALNRGRESGAPGSMSYDPKMLGDLSTPVYSSYRDGWGKGEMAATRFNPDNTRDLCNSIRQNLTRGFQQLCQELDVRYGKIIVRHPHVAASEEDRRYATLAMRHAIDRRSSPPDGAKLR